MVLCTPLLNNSDALNTGCVVITKKELNPRDYPLGASQEQNFEKLYIVMNAIRRAYGKAMIVSGPIRNKDDQIRIYKRMGKKPKFGSQHLQAAACDIWDPNEEFWHWCMNHMDFLITLGVWLEDKSATPTWVHLQIYPPRSGNRIFKP